MSSEQFNYNVLIALHVDLCKEAELLRMFNHPGGGAGRPPLTMVKTGRGSEALIAPLEKSVAQSGRLNAHHTKMF